jgi:2-C-methyl-D-erythritol 4-phosphate cytidylyltransferase
MHTPITWAIVPAGGLSARFLPTKPTASPSSLGAENKLLQVLLGQPVLLHTLYRVLAAASISGMVVAAHPRLLSTYAHLWQCRPPGWETSKPLLWVPGGETRQASVQAALAHLPDSVEAVVVHDAARPLVRPSFIDETVYRLMSGCAGVVAALPVGDTVKRATLTEGPAYASENGLTIAETLPRAGLWLAQTPQTFWRRLLWEAHTQASPTSQANATDDAQLVEQCCPGQVMLIPGDWQNIKLTAWHDWQCLQALAPMFILPGGGLEGSVGN